MARRSAQETLTAMASVRFPKLSAQRLAKLCQPTWLAGLISVGFHGVLFAASPTFTGLDLNTLTEPDPTQTPAGYPWWNSPLLSSSGYLIFLTLSIACPLGIAIQI
jgi:hypothetical protein